MGAGSQDADDILAMLIRESYVDDRRYAISFARGKFSTRKWGRIKIHYALRGMGIGEADIAAALEAIEEDEYMSALSKLLRSKIMALGGSDPSVIRVKVLNFAHSRGFEWHLCESALGQILKD
jgi:regulatory protein